MSILALYMDDFKQIMTNRNDAGNVASFKITRLNEHCRRINRWLEKNPSHKEWLDMAGHRTMALAVLETQVEIRTNVRMGQPSHGYPDNSEGTSRKNGLPINDR